MPNPRLLLCAVVLSVTWGAACDERSATTNPAADSARAGLALPEYEVEEQQGYPTARMSGTLELDDGCVYLDGSDPARLLVWYPGTHLVERDGVLTVVGPGGRAYGGIGQQVVLTGGDVSPSAPMVRNTRFDCEARPMAVVSPLD